MNQPKIELKELSISDGSDILEMIREIGPGENGFTNDGYNLCSSEFKNYLYKNIKMAKGIDLEQNRVPQTMYWLMVDG